MPFLYALTFANNKKYIGITTRSLKCRFSQHKKLHVTGKTAIYAAWRKHGEPTMQALAVVERDDLATTEIRAISVFNTLCPNGYNTSFGGDTSPMSNPAVVAKAVATRKAGAGYGHNLGRKMSPEICAAASKRMMGKKLSPETKAKVVAQLRALPPPSQETKEKRRVALAAWRKTPEGIATMKAQYARQLGRKQTQNARDVASATHKGKVLSEETKKKVSASQKIRLADPKVRAILSAHTSKNRVGAKHSEETKRKIGEFHKTRWDAIRAAKAQS